MGREESKIGDVIYGEPPIATCNLVLMATKMESRWQLNFIECNFLAVIRILHSFSASWQAVIIFFACNLATLITSFFSDRLLTVAEIVE